MDIYQIEVVIQFDLVNFLQLKNSIIQICSLST
jgi:hypothetical protein